MKKFVIAAIVVFLAGCAAIGGQGVGDNGGTFAGTKDMSYRGGQ